MVHLMSTGSYLLGLRPYTPELEDTTEAMVRAQVVPMLTGLESGGPKVPEETVNKIVASLMTSIQAMKALHPESSYPLPMLMTIEIPQQVYEKWGHPNVGTVLDLNLEPAPKEPEQTKANHNVNSD